jgi:glutathione S-transferase
MSEFHLIMGNRNYSSWSLRAWILMMHVEVKFRETVLPLDTEQFKAEIGRYSPTKRVPVLLHGDLAVWDSLAICEYVAEVTERGWPSERSARAVARAVCAEMHSGFPNLRAQWPMNAAARDRHTAMSAGLQADIDRVEEIWIDCRSRFGRPGPWLFGEYSVADAMYAPVVLRFNTYGARLSELARRYMTTALEDPALQKWLLAAKQEPWRIPGEEVGLPARP